MTKTDMPSVALAQEHLLPWLPLKETPGFGGLDIAGVETKFFGTEGRGPWFYLVRHAPDVHIPRHTHQGDVFHYILEGDWKMGSQKLGPGTMHFEQKGLYYGPFSSGEKGSVFLAIYDHEPQFIEPDQH